MRLLTGTMLILLIVGCGQKGPLFLPDKELPDKEMSDKEQTQALPQEETTTSSRP
jgi:predicted small lipoprotein YifL